MTALFRVSSATVSTLDLDELLEGTYNEIVAYLGVPSFLYIATYDAPRDTVRFEMFKREGRLHSRTTSLRGGAAASPAGSSSTARCCTSAT